MAGDSIQIYGDGTNVRDWLFVDDHVSGLVLALEKGEPGRSYNFGGISECSNSELVDMVCEHLDALKPRSDGKSYREQVKFIDDRLGHLLDLLEVEDPGVPAHGLGEVADGHVEVIEVFEANAADGSSLHGGFLSRR